VIGPDAGPGLADQALRPENLGGGNSNVKLVGSLSVGTRERILVVEVGEQWIVVGASPGRMNALATMPRQESANRPSRPPCPAPTSPTGSNKR
jgi:flagellar protein FliO/FliZ